MSIALSIASFVLSLLSVSFTGYISWDRWHRERRPNIKVEYEEYGDPSAAYLEVANKGDEDLQRVEIELRETLEGIVPVLETLYDNETNAIEQTRKVDIGTLNALQTKRIRVRRNCETVRDEEDDDWLSCVGGTIDLYAYCTEHHWWLNRRWRVPISIRVKGYRMMQ
jgi:hypothetical protein